MQVELTISQINLIKYLVEECKADMVRWKMMKPDNTETANRFIEMCNEILKAVGK